jgi:glycosyltransferase involved in cell wall biosynthesis
VVKISIITVCYNSERFIETAIKSVLEQTHPNVEYIVIDGGSTDGTKGILEKYSSFGIRVISEPDSGIYNAMNKGLKLATGDIIGLLNSDDFYASNTVLSEVARSFSEVRDLDSVMGGVAFVDSTNLSLITRSYHVGSFKPWMMRFGFMPPHPGVFFRKSVYDNFGYFNETYRIAADFEYLVRVLYKKGLSYKSVERTWVCMRSGGVSTAGIHSNLLSTFEMNRALSENDYYSNFIFLLVRLPIKYIKQVLFR